MSRRRKRARRLLVDGYGPECVEARIVEAEVRQEALVSGLTLRVSEVSCSQKRGTKTYHWMFETPGGCRVLDYWPGTGRIRNPRDGRTALASSPWEALEEALVVNEGVVVDATEEMDDHLRAIGRQS